MKRATKNITTLTAMTALLMLTACSSMQEKIANIGQPPPLSKIENPYKQENFNRVSMPMPAKVTQQAQPNSLWQGGRQTFFKDQRAGNVGDVLTILITITDQARMENSTERTREGEELSGVGNMLGYKDVLSKVLPGDVDTDNLLNMNSTSTSTGDGTIERREDINLKLAATITQVLPNGNFVIRGIQEVRVNNELRQLTLDGVIRPEDILNDNSISYEKIAEARISYGGAGTISDLQQPRYGQQFFDIVSPF